MEIDGRKGNTKYAVEISEQKQAALLADYQETREEIRAEMEFQNKRITQGIAAVGFLVGYTLLAGEPVALAFVPVIIVFVSLLSVIGHRSVLLLGQHASEIETELPYETFSWEHRYGVITPDNRRNEPEPWYTVLRRSTLFVGFLAYIGFLLIGYVAIQEANYSAIFGVPPSTILFSLYGLLTAFLGVGYVAHRRTKAVIQERLRQRKPGNPDNKQI